MAQRGVAQRGVVWCGCLCPLPSPARWGSGHGWKDTGPESKPALTAREPHRPERRQGKPQLFSTITRVQGVGHIPDTLELWVENVPALQRPFSQLPCYPAINISTLKDQGLGKLMRRFYLRQVVEGNMPLMLKSLR